MEYMMLDDHEYDLTNEPGRGKFVTAILNMAARAGRHLECIVPNTVYVHKDLQAMSIAEGQLKVVPCAGILKNHYHFTCEATRCA